jgi:hypothetical protein
MSAAVRCLSAFRVARYWLSLFLSWVLVGCATTPGRQATPVWNAKVHSSRFLLAMSDVPITGGAPSGPTVQGYNVPGRNPDSQMPWEFFLGNAAHRLIAYIYGVNHPDRQVFYNTKTIFDIIEKARLGETSHLSLHERNLRPDITDVTALSLFEIKPWNEQGLREGRAEVRIYLGVLNRIVVPEMSFLGGTDFQGEVLIRFARGQYIWRLEWRTVEPGVVQYRWTRSQQRFETEKAAYDAGQWVELTQQEMRQYGGWVGQAVEGMVNRREELATFSGAVGIVIEGIGEAATAFFSGVILGRMGAGTEAQQPPTQGGAQIIPFPARPSPAAAPVRVPAAAGMSLPH